MTVRAAVILMLGTQIAVAAGVLTMLAGNTWAVAALAAGVPSPALSPSLGP